MTADPLDFVVDALLGKGALVERDEYGASVVLPREAAQALALPEYARLQTSGEAGAGTPAGMGSKLLDTLLGEARAAMPVAWAEMDRPPARSSQASSLASRFVVRNGIVDVQSVSAGIGRYVVATFAYVAEADDRHEGTLSVAVCAESGARPDGAFVALADPRSGALRAVAERFDASRAQAWLAPRAVAGAIEAIEPFAAAVAKRHARDRARITEYFESLATEARAPRRKLDPEAIAAKVGHLEAECRAKLADLPARFTVRVRVEPVAALCAVAPIARVSLRVRRRKGERILALDLPPEARDLDALACEGCALTTSRPVVCDDALHVLCEKCAPSAQGRPSCRACSAARK